MHHCPGSYKPRADLAVCPLRRVDGVEEEEAFDEMGDDVAPATESLPPRKKAQIQTANPTRQQGLARSLALATIDGGVVQQ